MDWIEAQLKSYGCTNTERITYTYIDAAAPRRGGGGQRATPPGQGEPVRTGPGGSTEFGNRAATGVASLPDANAAARGAGAGAGGSAGGAAAPVDPVGRAPQAEIDARHRELNAEPSSDGERQEVYCTKIGTTRPNEMYIVGGHMDGIGWGEAANDDGSGAALVMQLARVFSSPDVVTDRSIRFILWNNEESGLNGSRATVEQRKDLQGKEDPAGSGRYPEPTWLGMIQHDMMLWDHGMPQPVRDASGQPMKDPQGRVIYHAPKNQRPEADVNIEFQSISKMSEGSQKLAWGLKVANDRYATNYPAQVGPHMTNTDSAPFQDLVPAISLRENERGRDIQAGWDPNWHQPTDVYTTYSDKDFTLSASNAARKRRAGRGGSTHAGATIKKIMIAVSHLSKVYGSYTAVDDLSFTVGAGEVVGLIGPNGAGKTSTLRCLVGIQAPSAGSVTIDGHDIVTDSVAAKQQVAFMADEPNLFEYLTR